MQTSAKKNHDSVIVFRVSADMEQKIIDYLNRRFPGRSRSWFLRQLLLRFFSVSKSQGGQQ